MLLQRRLLLKGAFAVAAAAAFPKKLFSAEPFHRQGAPRLMLSLAAYSFREYMKDANHKREKDVPADKQIDLFQFVDYCVKQDCRAAELTSYYFPQDVQPEFILDVKRHCFLRGVEISGTSVGNTFTYAPGPKRDEQIRYVKQWIDYASLMGAPHVRVFAGEAGNQSHKEAVKNCISALEDCCDYAAKNGVFLGIENHGGIVAEPKELLDIVRSVKNKWLGINLDSANFHTDDPYADFERCAEFAVNVQIKTEVRPRNQATQPSDLKRYVDILKRANYQGYVALEYEAAEDPYQAVPRALKELKTLVA